MYLYRCWCSVNDPEVKTDKGYFNRTEDVPISVITLEDTGSNNEYVDYHIGPLQCFQGNVE